MNKQLESVAVIVSASRRHLVQMEEHLAAAQVKIDTLTATLAESISKGHHDFLIQTLKGRHDQDLTLLNTALAAAKKDAERYRWLKAQKGLLLESSGGSWSKDGVAFVASHRLCCNGTSHAPYETLDETIDAARGVTDD